MLDIKSIAIEMKNAFDELVSSWTQLRKESLKLNIFQYKPPKLKSQGNKDREDQEFPDCVTTTEGIMHI